MVMRPDPRVGALTVVRRRRPWGLWTLVVLLAAGAGFSGYVAYQAREEIKSLTVARDMLAANQDTLQASRMDLTRRLEAAQEAEAKLRDDLDRTRAEVDEARKAGERLTTEMTQTADTKAALEQEIASLKEELGMARAKTTAKRVKSADATQVAPADGMPERHHDREASPPTKKLDGVLQLAHVDANANPSPSVTVPADPPPLPLKAGPRPPAGPVIEEHVRSVVARQIRAFRRRDGRAAFAIASPAVQSKFRDAHKFLEMVKTSYPDIPASKTASFLGLVRTRDKVIARFLLEGANGRSVEARYDMVRHAGRWRIDGCVIISR